MADDPCDVFVHRRRRLPFRFGKNVGGVENIEAFVFHGASVEIPDSNDFVVVEVTFVGRSVSRPIALIA